MGFHLKRLAIAVLFLASCSTLSHAYAHKSIPGSKFLTTQSQFPAVDGIQLSHIHHTVPVSKNLTKRLLGNRDYKDGTHLTHKSHYEIEITIDSQKIPVVVDTGSSVFWIRDAKINAADCGPGLRTTADNFKEIPDYKFRLYYGDGSINAFGRYYRNVNLVN